jgi:hypothetical protein
LKQATIYENGRLSPVDEIKDPIIEVASEESVKEQV